MVAPAIASHSSPEPLQRSHWKRYAVGSLLQVPRNSTSAAPSRASPTIIGGALDTGTAPATTVVGADVALPEPPELLAVSLNTIVLPTSAATSW